MLTTVKSISEKIEKVYFRKITVVIVVVCTITTQQVDFEAFSSGLYLQLQIERFVPFIMQVHKAGYCSFLQDFFSSNIVEVQLSLARKEC